MKTTVETAQRIEGIMAELQGALTRAKEAGVALHAQQYARTSDVQRLRDALARQDAATAELRDVLTRLDVAMAELRSALV